MARSISTIQQQLLNEKAAQTALSGLTSTSQTAIWRLLIYIQAVGINIFEQVLDVFKADIEAKVALSAPATPQWIQDKVFKFQYNTNLPSGANVVSILPDFSIGYTIVDVPSRVVGQCSIVVASNKTILVKVADKSTPPAPLSAPIQSALASYLDAILPAGLFAAPVSLNPDLLYVQAEVYYQGQYQGIKGQVEAALNNYLASFKDNKFDGLIRISEVEVAILSVQGVTDCKLINVKARPDSLAFGSAIDVYNLGSGINQKVYSTTAGYIKQETTGGATFSDTITYIPQ